MVLKPASVTSHFQRSSLILYEASIGRRNQCVYKNAVHMTKMAAMSVYGKNPSKISSSEPVDRFYRTLA